MELADEATLLAAHAAQLDAAAADGYALYVDLVAAGKPEPAIIGALAAVSERSTTGLDSKMITAFIEGRKDLGSGVQGFDEFVTAYNALIDWHLLATPRSSQLIRRPSEKGSAIVGVSRRPGRHEAQPDGMKVVRAKSRDNIDAEASQALVEEPVNDDDVLTVSADARGGGRHPRPVCRWRRA